MARFLLLGIISFSIGLTTAGLLDGLTTDGLLEDVVSKASSFLSGLEAIPELIPSLKKQKHSPNTALDVKKSYDYVIIGAGSAGAVLANRLSAHSCVSVVVLEAGSTPPILTEIPAVERFFVHSPIDWDFESVPQKRSGHNLKNRAVRFASGKVIGGSSVLNDVQYSRGNPQNYDDWASMGAKGWSYKDIYKYFLKLEDNRDPEYANDGYHSVGGPQTVSKPNYNPDLKKHLFEAAKSLKIPQTDANSPHQLGYHSVGGPQTVSKPNYNPDLKKHLFEAAKSLKIPQTDANSPHQLGIYDLQGTERDGQMCSVAKAYMVPADSRSNLDIVPDAFVHKIIIENGVAVGVEFKYKGTIRKVSAKKEVILSAGTINTPKILMLSGVGPADQLKKHKIKVNSNLPGVGENFQDHVGSIDNYVVNNTVNVLFKLLDPVNIGSYVHNRSGPFSAAQLVLALAYLQNQNNPGKTTVPDHQLYFVELNTVLPLLDFHLNLDAFLQVYLKYTFTPYLGCLIHLMHPRSRGTVKLKSANPDDPPLVDPNYFEDPADIHDIVEGLKHCKSFADTPSMKQIGTKRFDTLYPGCEQYAGDEDASYACQVITAPITYYHYAGTAKMGDPKDPMSVVDPELRVKGVKNLRVVDSSVMPTITTGNTNIPTIMIAEKASDMISSSINC